MPQTPQTAADGGVDLFEIAGIDPTGKTATQAPIGDVDLFELGGISIDVPKPKPQGIGGYVADAITDVFKRAGGAALSGVAAVPEAAQSGIRATVRSGAGGDPATVMPGGAFIPGIDTDEAVNGPMTQQQLDRRELQAERAAVGVRLPGAETLARAGRDAQKSINDTTSQATQDAVANSQITGNLLKGEIDFGKDPSVRGFLMQGADVFGSMFPVVATALATRSPGAAGAVGGAMAAGEGVENAREFIAKQSHEQLLDTSPLYRRMIDAGAAPDEARRITSAKAEDASALLQGAVATFGDRFTGKLVTGGLDPLLARVAGRSVLGKTAAGAGISALEEGTQELAEGVASDLGTKSVASGKEIGEDSAANFVLGALGGSAPGAARGVVAGVKDRRGGQADSGGRSTVIDVTYKDAEGKTVTDVATTADASPGDGAAAAPVQDAQASAPVAAPAAPQTEQQRVQQPDGTPESMDSTTAATRLAELEVIDSTTGLNPVQQEERAALAQRLEQDAAREADLEALGEEPEAVAAEAAAAEQAPAFDPGAVRSKTWPQFVHERGEKVATLRRGTPIWDQLQHEWAAVKTRRAGANPEGTGAAGTPVQEIQNRDRSRPASVVQMQGMAQNPDYLRLGVSRSPESGAPMVFAVGDQGTAAQALGRADVAVMSDGQRVPFRYAVMEAADVQPSNFADGAVNPLFDAGHPGTVKALNNGRTAGLRAAYERGTADAYRQELAADSDMHGIDPAVIEGMQAPVLVRLYSEKDNQVNMGAKSQSQALGLSATEQAATDAALVDGGVLEVFDSGALDSAANRDFARAFIGKLQEHGQDVAGMMDANGALSPAGITRLQAALVHKAYGDGDLVESLFGSTDNDIRAIGESLKAVAGEWANLRLAAERGAINAEADVTENLLQAIRLVQKARRERAALHDAVQQVDMLTGDVPDALTVGVLRLLYSGHYLTRPVGRDRLVESLRAYMGAALATSAAGDIFGEQVGPAAILAALSGQPVPQQQQTNDTSTDSQQAPAPQGSREPPGSDAAGERADAAGPEARRQEPDGAGRAAAGDRADGPGQEADAASGAVAPQLELSSYTPEEIQALLAQQQEVEQRRAREDAQAEAQARAERERKEVAERQAASAEHFQLGQDANDSLSGQKGIFDAPAEAEPAQRHDLEAMFDEVLDEVVTERQASPRSGDSVPHGKALTQEAAQAAALDYLRWLGAKAPGDVRPGIYGGYTFEGGPGAVRVKAGHIKVDGQDRLQFPIQRLLKLADPAKSKPRGQAAQKAAAQEAERAAYFTPGNIVRSQDGTHDRVVSYTAPDADGRWSVTVRPVEKEGDAWVDVPGLRERTHGTQPDARALKAGPVAQVPPERGAGEALASAAKNAGAGLAAAIDGLGELFGGAGKLGSGLSFDEQTYAKAKPLFAQAVANLQDAGTDLRDAMRAVVRMVVDKFGTEAASNMKPYVVRYIEDMRDSQVRAPDNTPNAKDTSHVSDPAAHLERHRPEPAAVSADARAVRGDPRDAAGDDRQAPGQTGRGDGPGRSDDSGVQAGDAAVRGKRSDQRVHRGDAPAAAAQQLAGTDNSQGVLGAGSDGVPARPVSAGELAAITRTARAATRNRSDSSDERSAESSVDPAVAPSAGEAAHLANVRAALPQLLAGQQEDVAKTERAFAAGPGMLLTNGTGTGKTFSGLGAVRRFVDAGKKNILVVVPDDKIGSDWMRSGRALDLNIRQLPDSTVAGQGVTLTTYANLGMNDALASRAWDLVVADEAHTLMSSQDATPTAALARLRAITMHPDGAHARYQMLHAADLQAAAELRQKADDAREAGKTDQAERLEARAKAAFEKLQADLQAVRDDVAAARRDGRRTKLLALSATPFAYELNVDWANGYLFDYDDGRSDESREFRGYNEGGNREQFFMQHFGYRMRYNKLTQPEVGVDRGLMQRQFNTWLKRRGVLSSRLLDVKADYDRRFVLFDSAIGNRIDEAFTWLADHRRDSTGHAKLEELVNKQVDYLTRRYLLEAIKATEAVPIVRAHMALGRKVVVFHDYIKGGGVNPFALDLGLVDAGDRAAVASALAEFQGQFGDLERAQLHKLPSPLQVFRQEFPELLVVNGREKRRDNLAAYEAFNDDGRGPTVMLVQSAKDKGWSGHDTTGKHQRVLINLGLPTSPTKSIQQEGRVYRTGQVSNAIMRYLNTGTSWERTAFASTIATRAATAENLALGELARSLQDAYVQAFEEADTYAPGHEGEGTGGKDMDRARNNVISEWDRARSLYFSQQKKTSVTKAREGADYFATPEPLGLKMVEWGDVREGEDTAEPSAGHGAIARWLPTHSRRTMVEPSPVLRSRLALADVRDSDRIVAGSFEDLAAANKYDVIAMNPPFGTAGRTAVDHLAKAYSHLREGGRVVAIIPAGPAADKKLEAWLYERADKAGQDGERPYTKPELHRAADVLLPASTFSRAAAGVMTRVVVLDKLAKGEQPTRAHRQIDLTDAASVEELFERLEHLDLPARTKPRQAAAAAAATAGPAPAGAQPATAPSTAAPQAQSAPAQPATGEPGSLSGQLPREGRPLVTHTTKSGKPLQGIVMQGMDRDTAMLYDPYTFKKDGGYFIRAKHLALRRGESAVAPAMTADLAQELLRIAGGNVPGSGRGAQQAPMARAQKVVDAVRQAWANAPHVNVVFDLQDPRVPQEARDTERLQAAEGAEGVPKGFYFDGEVYLVASQLATPEEAARVLYHEALGHHGLRGAFGEKLDAVLDQIIVARPREVRAKLQEYGELDDLVGRRYAAEEVLAEMAETQPQLGFVRRAVAAIRAWLRTHVPALRDLVMTDAEIIRDFILPARRWVERGALAAASAPVARPAFSLDSGAGRRALQELSELDDLFTFPKSEQTDLAAIAHEHDPEIRVSKPVSIAGRQEYTLTMSGGKKAILSVRQPNPYGGEQVYDMLYTAEGMEAVTGRPGVNPEDVPPTPDVWLDVSRLDQGDSGAMAYSIASTFAHNTDSIFIGDPHGLSKTALRRRLEQMISSALKFGTTRHLAPHPDQVRGGHGVPSLRWVYGDDVGNVERMIAASLEGMDNAFPTSRLIEYDADHGTFRRASTGDQLSRQRLADVVGRSLRASRGMDGSGPAEAEAGWRTVARAAVWRALLRRAGGQDQSDSRNRGSLLGELAERHSQVLRDRDPENRVFYSRGPAAGAATPAPSKGLLSRLQGKVADLTGYRSVDDFLYTWQDKFIDLKRIQEHIKALNGTVSETNDAYRGEELYHKRVAKRTANFLRDEVQPLLRRLNATGVAIEELERFLHARHAPEANRVMAERNPGAQQLQAQRDGAAKTVEDLRRQLQRAQARGMATGPVQKALGQALIDQDRWDSAEAFDGTEEERLSLSGMSDAEAQAIMAGYDPEQRQVLEELATRVDRINDGTLQTLENYGLMDQATLGAWRKTYQHYVPLHRDEAHPEGKAHPIGQGFSTRGDAAKRRTGSNERVTNILSHVVMQRETALMRGEKNNVAKRLYLLAAQNPDKDLWSLELPKKKVLDSETGLVKTVVDQAAKADSNVLGVRIGGKDQYIVFNARNEKAVRLAVAMKNLDAMELDRYTRIVAWITRWFASVNTQYNPVFGVMNLTRDLQGALLQLSTTPLAGKQAEVFRNIRRNTRAIYKDLRRERREEGAGTSEWAQLWEQLQLDGGTTGYRDLHADPKDRAKKLQKALDQVGEGKALGSGRALLAWLSDFNETLEATTRLGVYKAALDQGISRQEAASIAKNITVNFNRKGRNMPVAGAHFAFLNAAIQGNKRMLETLAGPAGRKIMMGGVALGMVSAMAGYLMMGGGDGADDEWKKIPDFVKERSIIIPLGRQDYVAIPLPLGFHVFPNIGRTIVEIAVHDDPTKSRMGHVLDMAVLAMDAYNPLGGSSNLGQLVSPTWLDPTVALWQNKDWTGREIYREDRSSKDPKPGAARAKDSTAAPFRWVATAANAATGGNEWRPGYFSPTPEAIEYLFAQITGGVGREASKVVGMATAAWTGEELAAHQLVLVGRVYGNSRGVNGQSAGYYENVKRINVSMAEAKGRVERGEDVDAVLLDVPLARLDGAAGLVDKHISNLVKARRRIQASDAPNKRELVKEVNAEIEASMHRLNQATAEVLRQVQH